MKSTRREVEIKLFLAKVCLRVDVFFHLNFYNEKMKRLILRDPLEFDYFGRPELLKNVKQCF
jgi:hypothetical protein